MCASVGNWELARAIKFRVGDWEMRVAIWAPTFKVRRRLSVPCGAAVLKLDAILNADGQRARTESAQPAPTL